MPLSVSVLSPPLSPLFTSFTELKIEYWPRLTKDKAKLQFLKTDFDKWVDEDEQDAADEVEMPDVSLPFVRPARPLGASPPGRPSFALRLSRWR